MQGTTWIWLILAVVVIVAGAVVMTGRQRKTKQAERAESLRSDASEQSDLVRQRESKAAEVGQCSRSAGRVRCQSGGGGATGPDGRASEG